MTSSIQTELRAYAWNAGEQPVEVLARPDYTGSEDNRIQMTLMDALLTKEFGKFTRIYPGNVHVQGGEITLLYRAFTDQYRGRIIVSGVDQEELDKQFAHYKKFCEQKVFSPAELYALRPARVDYDDYSVLSIHLQNELPNYFDIDTDKIAETKRFETRQLVWHDFDGRRTWQLDTVWFDGKPVMVVTSSGRDGDEYHERWITDAEAFGDLVRFLNSFLKEDAVANHEFVKASDVIPAMTEFYNGTIHDFYDVLTQEPKNK